MDLIDVFGIEFNNNSEKVDQISFLKLGRRKIRVKNCGFPPLDGTTINSRDNFLHRGYVMKKVKNREWSYPDSVKL